MSVPEALRARRSVRRYSREPLSVQELSDLVFAAYGKTARLRGFILRTAPSAGALYPVEVYLLVNSVEGVEPGVYHYCVKDHALELVRAGVLGEDAIRAAWNQSMAGESGVTFFLSVVFERCARKYGERANRYVYMDAGHVSQNIYLQATSLGLGSVAMAAFDDAACNALVGLDGDRERIVYLHAVGKPA